MFELGHSDIFALAGVDVNDLYGVKYPLFTDQLNVYGATKASMFFIFEHPVILILLFRLN